MIFILTPRDKLRGQEAIKHQQQGNSNQVAGKAANSSTTCYHLQGQTIPAIIALLVTLPSIQICLAAAVDTSTQRETI